MADFETTVDPKDLRVWASCAVDIDKLEVVHLGHSIEEFFDFLKGKNTTVFFHNLKFDGEFLISYLLRNGYTYNPGVDAAGKRLPLLDNEFTALITDDGLWYTLEVCFRRISPKKYEKVRFLDSLKRLPFKVAAIAKGFQLPMTKGEIDYKAHRPIGYRMTEEEKDYIIRDCMIVAQALKIQMEQGLTKMTTASNAMSSYKNMIGKGRFEKWFPVLPEVLDTNIRRSYRGGYTYLVPRFKNARGLYGKQYDVNSLYPWAMYDTLLPYGYPVFFEGSPAKDEYYPLFIVRLLCRFQLKEGHLPTIQLKNTGRFADTEYLTSHISKVGPVEDDDRVELVLTSVDLELFLEHYDVWDLDYLDGFRFKGIKGLFKEYIDYWMSIKENSTGAVRQLAKLQLNSLYGRFAMSTKGSRKKPQLDDNDIVEYEYLPEEHRDPVFTAMACFITAYARDKTIRSAQANYDRFIYADTDSLKLVGYEDPVGLDVHPTRLGAWKDEGDFTDSKFIRAKTYMMTVDGETKVTCAGMPDNVKLEVTYDNFHTGSTFFGKLVPRRYPGGVILEETDFTIR